MSTPEDDLPYQIPPGADCSWCKTGRPVKVYEFCHLWTIEKFSYLQEETGKCIESSTFSSIEEPSIKWRLHLHPRGDTEEYDCLSICLKPGGRVENVVCRFFIIDENGEKKCEVGDDVPRTIAVGLGWGYPVFVLRDYLMDKENKLLRNDDLTILCEIEIFANRVGISGRFKTTRVQDSIRQNLKRLLLESTKLSDVVLVVEGKEVHAHKTILALASPVFAAMFQDDMEEKRTNRVNITDIDHGVLQEMVRFIYTRQAPTMEEEMASLLLAAADKYALEELKGICEESLSENLTPEKVIALIPLASLYRADNLTTNLIDFIKLHTMDDAIDHLWKNLISISPNRAIEIFHKKRVPTTMIYNLLRKQF